MAIDPLSGMRGTIAMCCQTQEDRDSMTRALLDWDPVRILGGLSNYDLNKVEAFVESLRRNKNQGENYE